MNKLLDRSAIQSAALLIALALVFSIGVFSRAIWYDEAITLQSLAAMDYVQPEPGIVDVAALKPFLEGRSTLGGVISHYIEADVHPPLYFIAALAGTTIAGTSIEAVRFVSVILVLAATLLFGSLLRRAEISHPFVYMAVFGLSSAAVTSAQDGRGYAMVLLGAVAAWYFVVLRPGFTTRRAQVLGEFGLGIAAAGLLYTHYFAVLVVAALMAFHVISGLKRRDGLTLVAPVICALLFLPWVPVLLDHLGVRPDQFNGFRGVLEFAKRSAFHIGGLVLSPTFSEVPGIVSRAGRALVILIAMVGVLVCLRGLRSGDRSARLATSAIMVPALTLVAFTAVSIILDKWFDTLRYFLFIAPFVVFLTTKGALTLGQGLARLSGIRWVVWMPVSVLLALQAGMLNFGWEANSNRGGSYFASMAEQVRALPVDQSAVIIDGGYGRGTLLVATHVLPEETLSFLLPRDPNDWERAASALPDLIKDKKQVVLMFTIERGAFGSDKVAMYAPIVASIEAHGFKRTDAPPRQMGQKFYARWIR